MNKLMASILEQNSMLHGVVKDVDGDTYVIVSKEITLKAKKAFSCLLTPVLKDKVLVSVSHESVYITAILERDEESTLDIVAKGGINIVSQEGDITFNAEESLNAFASKSNVVISEVSFLSNITNIKAQTINVISSIYQGFIDKVSLRYKSVDKIVEGHEENQSLSSRRIVKGTDIHQVQESITSVKGQMKVDASIINMG